MHTYTYGVCVRFLTVHLRRQLRGRLPTRLLLQYRRVVHLPFLFQHASYNLLYIWLGHLKPCSKGSQRTLWLLLAVCLLLLLLFCASSIRVVVVSWAVGVRATRTKTIFCSLLITICSASLSCARVVSVSIERSTDLVIARVRRRRNQIY